MFIPNPPSAPIINNRRGPYNYNYPTNDLFIDGNYILLMIIVKLIILIL